MAINNSDNQVPVKIDLTLPLKLTIGINILLTLFLAILGLFSLSIAIDNYYTYYIKGKEIIPWNPPLIYPGLIIFFIYSFLSTTIAFITYKMMKYSNFGRKMGIIIIPFLLMSFSPISIILAGIQFYSLVLHKETLYRFNTVNSVHSVKMFNKEIIR